MNLTQATTITQFIGYFAFSGNPNDPLHGNFNPNDPALRYHDQSSPTSTAICSHHTGSLAGDIFTGDNTAGPFAGRNRLRTAWAELTADITHAVQRSPHDTLQAGAYWFRHDASIAPVPSRAAWMEWALVGGLGGGQRYPQPPPPTTGLTRSFSKSSIATIAPAPRRRASFVVSGDRARRSMSTT
jgi:hypothetical protein